MTNTRTLSEAAPTRLRGEAPDEEYWIDHCEGYRVDSQEGCVGVVEAVLEGAEKGRAAAIVVARGLFVPRSVLIAREAVVGVVPREKRLLVDTLSHGKTGNSGLEPRTGGHG